MHCCFLNTSVTTLVTTYCALVGVYMYVCVWLLTDLWCDSHCASTHTHTHIHRCTHTVQNMQQQMEGINTWECYRNCLLNVTTEMCAWICITALLERDMDQNNGVESSFAFYFSVWFFLVLFLSPSLFHLLSFAVPSHTLLALLPRVMGSEIGVTVGICSPALHDGTQNTQTLAHTPPQVF